MNFKKVILLAALSSIVFFTSCTNDDGEIPIAEAPLGAYDNGTLVLNQGGFGNGNASISYISDNFSVFQNNIFSIVNPTITLGDTGQDIGFYGNTAYIVLNNSQKIEIVNRYTMQHTASITTGLSNPRYIAFANGNAYVTNWGNGSVTTDDYVAVINLATNTITSTIPVAEGPEKLIIKNDKLYVAHQGGYGFGNTVSVINILTNTVSNTISVGDIPNSLEENNGTLYVLCGGKASWTGTETAGKLVKINLASDTVSGFIDFGTTQHPSNLEIENLNMYYTVGSSIFKTTPTATTLPTTEFFTTTNQGVYGVYSFAVRNSKIFVGDAGNYSSNGKVYIYSESNGSLVYNYTVGIIPAGFYFN